ncbi:conserved hypothetical protein [Pediculus humanus corporis]|uniref:RAB6-interacting golgin n=1 Tax=Pediculus humanus subsp. corporis TaxID=121224 RepID=E0VXI2_PEDHC|nr:uncharacterized protein Phum_PHUM500940 [Pediculus humanus corporis]EEB18088.1 conserved hypothetical protein [Pediculus humanus corporis]
MTLNIFFVVCHGGGKEKSSTSKKSLNRIKSGETQKHKINYESLKNVSNKENDDLLPESAKLHRESNEKKKTKETNDDDNKIINESNLSHTTNVPDKTSLPTANFQTSIGTNPICIKIVEGKAYELVDRKSTEMSKSDLEIFEARQKVLEEQNKKRKEMLAKIILDRKKQTTEEAKRLQHIQEELQKLDLLLSSDVGILRNKIEEASLDFAEAQKRYNKAEKEFLDSKQNLFVKLEKKELLTKLLCTIIEQNELRKAQKLSELMEKLEVKDNGKRIEQYEKIVPDDQSASTTNSNLEKGDDDDDDNKMIKPS